MIHPTAVISSKAHIDPSVIVGPYAVIDGHVALGPGCKVGPHVYLTGWTTIGAHNHFHAGSVIGDAPQDLKYKGEPTRLTIGDRNVFREGSTVHRSAKEDEATSVGSNCFIMANAHIGHNAQIGNHVIMANGALMAGHVQVADRVFISGNCMAHQFVRIGTMSLMQGGSAISQDLPPFTIARGFNNINGLNIVGLRRAGVSPEDRLQLKKLYRALFLSERNISQIIEAVRAEFTGACAQTMLDFIASSKRGVCAHHGSVVAETDENDDAID